MSDTTTPATVYLGLGSNLGPRRQTMRAAVFALDEHPQIRVDFETGVASLYETSPVGCSIDQPPYLNSAVRVLTTLGPFDLLNAVLSVEASLGRVRRERWGQRLIDIDLLLYDDVVIDANSLTLPHPRLHERRFVLEPLSEVAADRPHPRLRTTIGDLACRLRAECNEDIAVRIAGPHWCR